MKVAKLSFNKHPIFKIIIGGLIILVLYLGVTSTIAPYEPPEPTVLSILETYEKAFAVAHNWQPDAQLHSIHFDIELHDPEQNWCLYHFLSPGSQKLLSVHLDKEHSKTAVTHSSENDWPLKRPMGTPINPLDLNLESQQALDRIIDFAGYDFFNRHQVRDGERLSDHYSLELEHLNDFDGEGLITWTGSFHSSDTSLHVTVDDSSGYAILVRAQGDSEIEYWFKDSVISERIIKGRPIRFFDYFDLRLDEVYKENGKYYVDLTILAPNSVLMKDGKLVRNHLETYSDFRFGDYIISVLSIGPDWVEVQVMPTVKWYIPIPEYMPR